MTIGPVQLLVLGFNDPQARGAIADELKRLRDSDMVRVVRGQAWADRDRVSVVPVVRGRAVDGRWRQENRPVTLPNGLG